MKNQFWWIQHVTSVSVLFFLSAVTRLAYCNRKGGDHVFYDTQLISVIDPLKHGFDIVLTDAAHEYLLVNPFQLPALYISAIPLNGGGSPALRQMLFKDNVVNKLVKVEGLQEKSWYYLCLEYETFSIGKSLNETTGTQCQAQRTLDKFGKGATSTITDVSLIESASYWLQFKLFCDANFPLRLTVYLDEGSVPAQILHIQSPRTLHLRFGDLEPDYAYGRICVLEEPLLQSYTAMGRTIQTRMKHCFLDRSLKTKLVSILDAADSAPYVGMSRDSRQRNSASMTFSHQSCRLIVAVNFTLLILSFTFLSQKLY